MKIRKYLGKRYQKALIASYIVLLALPLLASGRSLSDREIAKEIEKASNKAIIEAFLKYELREVNKYATIPLLKKHPSLEL